MRTSTWSVFASTLNLLPGERNREAGRMGAQLAARLLRGGGDFLLGRMHHSFDIFLAAVFWMRASSATASFSRVRLHLADFDVQLPQTSFNVGERGGILAGGSRFF